MRLPLLLLPLLFMTTAAYGEEDTSALIDRLDRLERDVSFVQKQVYRSSGGSDGGAPVNSGQMQVRFTQIDEELRQIRGLIEQTQFQNRQNAVEFKKFSSDVDYRLRALEQQQQQTAMQPIMSTATPTPSAMAEPTAVPPMAEPKVAADGTKPALTGKDFPDANAHYSHAFKLLSEKKFAESAASFDAFIKTYPSDPLTSNAYYWLGESQYVRKDFTRAAESFRKGFEVNPDGQKAPDNLYKLAMSLSQVKRTNEACIVLAQVINKYGETAVRTAARAQESRTTLQCK